MRIVGNSTKSPKEMIVQLLKPSLAHRWKICKSPSHLAVDRTMILTDDESLFLNPEVGSNCTHLLLDYYYCVRPVGNISTYPGYGGAQTDDAMWVELPMKSVPRRDIMASYRASKPVIPMANGTRRDCNL